MEGELKARKTTTIVLIHFTGDETTTYSQVRKESRRQGTLDTGYHFIMERDGKLLMGRHQSKVGSHYQEYDDVSVGILVVAKREDMSEAQSVALTLLLDKLRKDYPSIESVKYIYRTE
jgi:N-acetylmuramoyl-L-alanine amidase